jgi:hypothetical protein
VRDFGTVREVASLMQAELTARQARCAAALVVVAFPVLVGGWDLLCAAVEPWGSDLAPPIVSVLYTAQELAIGGIAVLAFVLLLATFRPTISPRWITVAAALLGTLAVVVCSATGIAMSVVNAIHSDNVLVLHPLGTPVLAASIGLFCVVLRSAARSLRVARCPR